MDEVQIPEWVCAVVGALVLQKEALARQLAEVLERQEPEPEQPKP